MSERQGDLNKATIKKLNESIPAIGDWDWERVVEYRKLLKKIAGVKRIQKELGDLTPKELELIIESEDARVQSMPACFNSAARTY